MGAIFEGFLWYFLGAWYEGEWVKGGTEWAQVCGVLGRSEGRGGAAQNGGKGC